MKECSKCKILKPLSDFGLRKERKCGYRSQCKQCGSLYDKRVDRLVKRRLSTRIWYKNNSEYAKNKTYEWRKLNPEGNAINVAIWRLSHPEQSINITKRYQKNHPNKVTQFRHARRARVREAEGSFSGEAWAQLKADYEFGCLSCGKSEPEILLTADHIVPLSRGGTNNIENIQPLCMQCNSRKHTKMIDFRQIGKLRFYNVDMDTEKGSNG